MSGSQALLAAYIKHGLVKRQRDNRQFISLLKHWFTKPVLSRLVNQIDTRLEVHRSNDRVFDPVHFAARPSALPDNGIANLAHQLSRNFGIEFHHDSSRSVFGTFHLTNPYKLTRMLWKLEANKSNTASSIRTCVQKAAKAIEPPPADADAQEPGTAAQDRLKLERGRETGRPQLCSAKN